MLDSRLDGEREREIKEFHFAFILKITPYANGFWLVYGGLLLLLLLSILFGALQGSFFAVCCFFFSPPTTQIQTHTHTTYICLSKPRMYDKLIVSIKWNEMIRPNKTSLPPRNDVNSKRIKKSGILINNHDGIWRIVFGCSVSLNLECILCRETKQREKKNLIYSLIQIRENFIDNSK